MMLELKKFDAFPAHIELVEEETRTDAEIESVLSIDKTMLDLDIQKSGDEYYCQGELTAEVHLECARCLKSFKEKLVNSTDFIAGPYKEDGVPGDDEDHVFYDNDLRADLWDIVRQTVILAVSIKPLCSENCKGLCPQCGTDRNKKTCNCKTETVDPRMAPLKNLLQNETSQTKTL
jgi:uncharacterized protein